MPNETSNRLETLPDCFDVTADEFFRNFNAIAPKLVFNRNFPIPKKRPNQRVKRKLFNEFDKKIENDPRPQMRSVEILETKEKDNLPSYRSNQYIKKPKKIFRITRNKFPKKQKKKFSVLSNTNSGSLFNPQFRKKKENYLSKNIRNVKNSKNRTKTIYNENWLLNRHRSRKSFKFLNLNFL